MTENRNDDIFDQVAADTKEQIQNLSTMKCSTDSKAEYNEILEEIKDTVKDLQKSVEVIRRNDPVSAQIKESEVEELNKLLHKLEASKNERERNQFEESNVTDFMDENDGGVNSNQLGNAVQNQMFHEQTEQLDVIHLTMGQLQQQARTMGDELLDQSELLDQMDEGMDTLGSKLHRGRKQLEWIYEKNRERWNDCCIVLLIIALIVLLVIAVVI